MQRHDIWRRVEYDYGEAKKRAPAGNEPFVRVYLAGQEPITLGFVTTRRAPDDVWIRFEAEAPEPDDEDTIPAECYWVHVAESAILGIEIGFRPLRTGRVPVGFRYEESDE